MQTGLCTSRSWLYILPVSCVSARRVQPKHGLASMPEHKEGRPVTNCVKRSAMNGREFKINVEGPTFVELIKKKSCTEQKQNAMNSQHSF